uniref:Reticulon-like protein n=1 Tax=Quercus lobata TaxID=97700 RepID=A0A7N2R8B3_QUELO
MASGDDGTERWCVVTGGRGFAARHLVEKLISYNMFLVRIADMGPTISLDPHEENGTLGQALRSAQAVYVSMDLRNKDQVLKALEGAEVVFHMAAPNSSINNYQLHYSVNVEGTKNVIDACIEHKVKRLIYTSSPSVVFDGVHGILDGDESVPYPAKHNDSYSATKSEGEALVIKSNGTKGLLTCCIRPSSIFGPGDKLFVPSLVDAARAGKLKFIVGDGNNIYDFTYVENVAHAHICAERALASGGMVAEKASGQFWIDVWCRDRPLKEVFPDLYNISRSRDVSVSEVLCYGNGRIFWDLQFRRLVNDQESQSLDSCLGLIYSTKVRGVGSDKFSWKPASSRGFLVSGYYHSLSPSIVSSFPWKLLWLSKVPPRVAFFSWTAALGKILTIDNLRKRHLVILEWCYMCKRSGESVDHLLLHCPFAFEMWSMAYFITNMERMKFWEFVSVVLEGLGYERPRIKIPAFVVMPIAHMVEWAYRLLGPYGMKVPQLTPSRIRLLSCSRSFNCSKAKDLLGYAPVVPLQEGLKRTIESYSHLRAEHPPKREGPSKASIYLGKGRVADTLLWRDKKRTLTALLVLVAIYYNFIASGFTLLTTLSKLLLATSVFLFIHGILPEKVLGYTVEKIPRSRFHLSEEMSRRVALSVASSWNAAVDVLKSLSTGHDWTLFLKVVLSLLLLSLLGAVSFQSLFVIGLPVAFLAIYVYEKKEQEIDAMVMDALTLGCKLKSEIVRKFVTSKSKKDQ